MQAITCPDCHKNIPLSDTVKCPHCEREVMLRLEDCSTLDRLKEENKKLSDDNHYWMTRSCGFKPRVPHCPICGGENSHLPACIRGWEEKKLKNKQWNGESLLGIAKEIKPRNLLAITDGSRTFIIGEKLSSNQINAIIKIAGMED